MCLCLCLCLCLSLSLSLSLPFTIPSLASRGSVGYAAAGAGLDEPPDAPTRVGILSSSVGALRVEPGRSESPLFRGALVRAARALLCYDREYAEHTR